MLDFGFGPFLNNVFVSQILNFHVSADKPVEIVQPVICFKQTLRKTYLAFYLAFITESCKGQCYYHSSVKYPIKT